MDSNRSLRPSAASGVRVKQMKEAREMQDAVKERAAKLNITVPSYEFQELIGKGTFGRVFKCKGTKEGCHVAVKVIEIDSSDYKLDSKQKDEALKDFLTEINALRTLKDSKARNINIMFDAFSFSSQLWIVSEYCPGGSVHTLMKASPRPGLEEKFIIPIARELAVALKHVHDAGIIHRDVKAANVLITHDGKLQLCDFGVSGVLESNAAKRSTIIGTPNWMAPEMHAAGALPNGYGTEVDCWAFGCTIYELATGQPPNAKVAPQNLGLFLKRAPRLEGDDYSQGLREFVSFCLEERPEVRPSAGAILMHPYLFNTSKKMPTFSLKFLIERFNRWEEMGGQRASLFNPNFGAAGLTNVDDAAQEDDEWNFSTAEDFAQDLLSQFPPREDSTEKFQAVTKEITPPKPTTGSAKTLTPLEKAIQDQRAQRGELKMGRLFDEKQQPYEYSSADDSGEPFSDLPLRSLTACAANRETVIDLDAAHDLSDTPSLSLADVPTIRPSRVNRFYQDDDDFDDDQALNDLEDAQKRATKDWKYPMQLSVPTVDIARPRTQDWTFASATFQSKQPVDENIPLPNDEGQLAPAFRPVLKHTATEPLGNIGDYLHPPPHQQTEPNVQLSTEPPDRASLVDLDLDSGFVSRPSTSSSAGESFSTDITNGNPFDLEDDTLIEPFSTIRARTNPLHERDVSLASTLPSSSPLSLSHSRDNSFTMSDSEFEQGQLSQSIQNPAKSPGDDTYHDYWNERFRPDRSDKMSLPKARAHLLRVRDNRSNNLGAFGAGYDSDTDPTLTISPRSAQAASKRLDSLDVPEMRSPGRRRERTNYEIGRMSVSEGPGRGRRRVVNFPRPIPPDLAAFESEADLELVMSELDRLIGDYLGGLRVATRLLKPDEDGTSTD